MKKHSSPAAQPRKRGAVEAETSAMVALFESRQWNLLEAAARRMTARCPAHPSGWTFLGLALQGLEKLAEAVAAHERARRLAPQDAGAHGNLGAALKACGRLAEAETSYRKALAIQPNHAGLHFNLGNLLRDSGRLAEAEASYQQALEIRPDYVAAQTNLGSVLRDLGDTFMGTGRFAEAESCYRRVLAIKPMDIGTHLDLGNVMVGLDRLAEAEDCYRRVLAIEPRHAGAYNNLGNMLKNTGRFAEAEGYYRQVLAIEPRHAGAYNNLGNVLKNLGRLAEAEDCYRWALAIQPDDAGIRSNLLFCMSHQADPSAPYIDEASEFGRRAAAAVKARFSSWACTNRPERLRVGFVSGDLRSHPVGYFMDGVLAHLDLASIEAIAYTHHPMSDELTHRLRSRFAAWQSLVGLDDETAARLIHADGIHVLIDLSGHTLYNRLPVFAWKPAPVQAMWLGYWATTGVAEMDWFLADETGVPEAHRAHFTERVWCLPETRLCFTPPDTDPPAAPLPAMERGFVTFGSFQKLAKISDEVLRLWGRVLAACPGSRLRLQDKSMTDARTVAALRGRMIARNIDPGRVDLHGAMPRREYLAAHAEVDILLDTFPFTGGTTTCEALWMGVPTLTLAGETLIARQGASLLTAAGLPDWIAADDDEYVAKAVAFASDLEALAGLRAGLREQVLASPLFDAPRFARNLEDALWGMWEGRNKIQQP